MTIRIVLSASMLLVLGAGCKESVRQSKTVDTPYHVINSAKQSYTQGEFYRYKNPEFTAEEIVKRHLEAMGGEKAAKEIKTLHVKYMKIWDGDTTVSDSYYYLGKKAVVRSCTVRCCSECYYTSKCPESSFVSRRCEDMNMADTGPVGIKEVEPFSGYFYGYGYYQMPGLLAYCLSHGIKVERTDIEQDLFYNLGFTLKDGRMFTITIDPTTYLVVACWIRASANDLGGVIHYENFKSTKSGYWYPTDEKYVAFSENEQGEISPDSNRIGITRLVEYNPEIPPDVFKLRDDLKWFLLDRSHPSLNFPIKYFEEEN